MKKQILLLLAVLLLLAAAGNSLAEEPAAFIPPEPGEDMSVEKDMGLLLNGIWYPILSDFRALHEALGEPLALSAAPSCVFVGEDKEFAFQGLSVFTNPVGEQDIWFELVITDNTYATSRGIRIGDTLEVLENAYGGRCYWEGESILTYSISGVEGDYASPCLMFEVAGDVITGIDMYYPTNVTHPAAP